MSDPDVLSEGASSSRRDGEVARFVRDNIQGRFPKRLEERYDKPVVKRHGGPVMKCYDVSRPLQNTLAAWPGDTPFDFHLTGKIAEGCVVNVGAIAQGTHNGTHADAPFHYLADGTPIDQLPLELFMGPAVLVDVSRAGWVIGREHLAHAEEHFADAPRLVLKTGGWPDSTRFPERIPTLAPDVPGWLGAAGVRLIALDVPSVDVIESKTLPVHHALAAANICIIESLDLSQVPEGIYELIALPLKIAGGDASPIRAVLRGSPVRQGLIFAGAHLGFPPAYADLSNP